MPDLNFKLVGAEVPDFAAVPMIIFKLHIANVDKDILIHSIALRSQLQIAVKRRQYSPAARAHLLELFGAPERWGETVRDLLWTHTSVVVPQFSTDIVADLPVPCTYDFEVVSTKYFSALEDGEIPLTFLFSGTIFYAGADGRLQVGQIAWSKEASFRFPVLLWREMMARYYPNSAWIHMHKDVFDQLYQYKVVHSLPTWEEVFTQLLQGRGEEAHA